MWIWGQVGLGLVQSWSSPDAAYPETYPPSALSVSWDARMKREPSLRSDVSVAHASALSNQRLAPQPWKIFWDDPSS